MIDDPIGRLETDESPAIPPAWTVPPDTQAHAVAPEAEVARLRGEARAQSKSWTLSGRRSFSPAIDSRRQGASRAVLSIRKSAAAERGVPAVASQLVVNNQRLLRSSSLDIRSSLRSKSTFPQVRTGGAHPEEVPRAYLAAKAYLTATHFIFEEPSFIEFMEAAQEAAYFEVAEIWRLKQMLQLVLIERFAELTAEVSRAGGARNAQDPQAERYAAEFSSLIDNIRKLSDSDFKAIFLALSKTEAILRGDPANAYPGMDLDSRGSYHAAIQEFVRG